MRHLRNAAILLGVLALAPSALADDSSATLGAGGLVLTHNADIRMASEDLYLSPKAVRVRYAFVNDSDKDIDTIVAFPLPDAVLPDLFEGDNGVQSRHSPNFVDFRLMVDGATVPTTGDERAMLNGRDVTAKLRAAGLPINLINTDLRARLEKLTPAQKKALATAKLIDDGGAGQVVPLWTALTKFWWRQHFGAHKTVIIDHSYTPVSGQSFFGLSAFEDSTMSQVKDYCIDAPTRAAIDRKLEPLARQSAGVMLNAYYTDFVIVTANNWKSPIGRFHLTLDKLKPDNILSLCWDGDLKKTSATRFEATRLNFAPRHDIKMMVLFSAAEDAL